MLPASQGGEPVAGDNFRLPPIKIVGKASKPEHKLTAHFEDGFSLQGYSLHLPDEVLRPGDAFTVTLAYRNDEATGRDATRFVHLYNPELGLAAQFDSPPQDGINPTWSWMPGETITDQVRLTVAEDAQPGQYSLLLGFYDPQAGAVRLSVSDDDGSPFVDNVVPLQEIVIQSAP